MLPSICLGLAYAAEIARITRTGMLDALSQDYVRTARAKGLSELTVALATRAAHGAVAGCFVLRPGGGGHSYRLGCDRKIFAIPGLGWHFVQAALQRDYTLAMGLVLLYTRVALHDEFYCRPVVRNSRSAG